MLRQLDLSGVGPADKLTFGPLAERLNLITGDNGLGKSFLLDLAWWVLTRTWPSYAAVPKRADASIGFAFDGSSGVARDVSRWVPGTQGWQRKPGRPPNPGLVVYARVDGSFSVWDPAKNYRLYQGADGREREVQPAFHFGSEQVLEELRSVPDNQVVCRGLIDDWTRWSAAGDPRFDLLARLLAALSEDPEHPMEAGKPARPFLGDVRDIPTVKMPYGEVPLIFAAAGMQRMLKLAYLLTWAFSEHEEAAVRQGLDLANQVVLLIDEPESHLHPRWQRRVLVGLMAAVDGWRTPAPRTQVIAATHSPLVLASLEPIFDTTRDALWTLDLEGSVVKIEQDAWRKRGDANRWLTSHAIGLGTATSAEVEAVLGDASRLLRAATPDPVEIARVNEALTRVLPEMDPFLLRWRHYAEQRAGSKPA